MVRHSGGFMLDYKPEKYILHNVFSLYIYLYFFFPPSAFFKREKKKTRLFGSYFVCNMYKYIGIAVNDYIILRILDVSSFTFFFFEAHNRR